MLEVLAYWARKSTMLFILLRGSTVILAFLTFASCNERKIGSIESDGSETKAHRLPSSASNVDTVNRETELSEKDNSITPQAQGVLEEFRHRPANTPADKERLLGALRILAKTDPRAALDYLGKLAELDASSAGDGFFEVSKIIASANPEALKQWLLSDWSTMNSGSIKDGFVDSIFYHLGVSNPNYGTALLREIQLPLAQKLSLIGRLFSSYGVSDPLAAISLAKNIDPAWRDQALSALIIGAAKTSPELAMGAARDISDPAMRNAATAEVFRGWLSYSAKDAAAAFGLLDPKSQTALLKNRHSFEDSLLFEMVKKEPQLAFSIFASLKPDIQNRPIFEAFAFYAVNDQPRNTLEFINSLPGSQMKSEMFELAFNSLASTNLTAAIGLLNETLDTDQRALALKRIGTKIGELGFAQTLATIGHLDGSEKGALFESAYVELVKIDLKPVVDFVSGDIDSLQLSPTRRQEVISNVAYAYAREDANDAIDWFNGLRAPDKVGAMRGLAGAIASTDMDALGQFLNTLPQDETWAEGARVIIQSAERVDETKAQPWKSRLESYNKSKKTK